MNSLPVYAKFLPIARTFSMTRMKSLPVYAKFLPNARTFSMKRMKSLPVYAKFLPNARTCSMKRMKSLRVYAKLSPRARYGFKSWKTRCSKSLRSDSTQFSVNAASKDFTGLAVPIPLVS